MSVFVHAQGIKIVHAGGEGVKKWQNYVHVVVECPLTALFCSKIIKNIKVKIPMILYKNHV